MLLRSLEHHHETSFAASLIGCFLLDTRLGTVSQGMPDGIVFELNAGFPLTAK